MYPAYIFTPGPSIEIAIVVDSNAVVICVACYFWIKVYPADVFALGKACKQASAIIAHTGVGVSVVRVKIYPAYIFSPHVAG